MPAQDSSLKEHAAVCDVVRSFEEQPPPLDGYDVVIVGGTPDPVYDRSRHPYLNAVYEGRADPLLRGFPERFDSFQWHGDTFEIPAGGKHLIAGDRCLNQMFRWKSVAGVQFHLEISPREAVRWAERYADELAAFGKSIDDFAGEFAGREERMQELATLLIANYVDSIHASQ